MENKNRVFSKVFNNGTMIETVYNTVEEETLLAIYKDGQYRLDEKFTDEKGTEYYPIQSSNDLLKKGFVKLASGVSEISGNRALYQQVRDYIAQYMNIPDDFLAVSAVYVLMSWVYEKFNTLAYLRVIGNFGTGKSRYLKTLGRLTYKSMNASGVINTAGIFRTTDFVRGTLIMDEADWHHSDMSSQNVKTLNAGHGKDSPAIRMKTSKLDGSMTTDALVVFGPKILASRQRFQDEALESRCLTQFLLPIKKVSRAIDFPPESEMKAEELRNKLLAFRFANYHKTSANEDSLKNISFPRLQQSALALTTVASNIGDDVHTEVIGFLQRYEKSLQDNQTHDIKFDILVCITDLLKDYAKENIRKMYMRNISDQFDKNNYEDYTDIKSKTNDNYNHSVIRYKAGTISPHKVGFQVRALGINVQRDSEGYHISLPDEIQKIISIAERYGIEVDDEKDLNQQRLEETENN